MKAMVFAAGLGTRLRPFTLEHPKALVEVGGVPMLQRVILKLKEAGIEEMVVNVHHFAEQIVDFLRANDSFGVDIHISDETPLLLDTGGGILAARQWLQDDDFVVHNADILTDFNIQDLCAGFCGAHADATLLVAPRKTSRYLLFDDELLMRGWTNITTGQVKPVALSTEGLRPLAFGGVHVLSGGIYPALESFADGREVFSIIDFYVEYCRKGKISGFMPSYPYNWHDIGKPEALEAAIRSLENHERS